MNPKITIGTLTLGAVVLAGILGIVSLMKETEHAVEAVDVDEFSDEPIGI